MAGWVTVTARLTGYSDGVATFVITAHALAQPVHKLLQQAVQAKASGVTVTNLQLVNAVIHAEAAIGTVTLHRTTEEARRGEPESPSMDR